MTLPHLSGQLHPLRPPLPGNYAAERFEERQTQFRTLARRGFLLPEHVARRPTGPQQFVTGLYHHDQLKPSIEVREGRVHLLVKYTGMGSSLNLDRFARAARRAGPGLLGAALETLERVCRHTRPVLVPQAALNGLHEQVHGDWADLLDLQGDLLSDEEIDTLIRGQGLHAAGDAPRLYDVSAARPSWKLGEWQVDGPANVSAALRTVIRRLLSFEIAARPHLSTLTGSLNDNVTWCVFDRHVVTHRRRKDHLGDLRDQLSGLDSDCAVYAADFRLDAAGGRQLQRVLRALHELSELSARSISLLEEY